MTKYDMERYKNKMHHRAVFTLTDGTSKEGYMQPWDDEFVYLTTLDGGSAGRVALAEVKNVTFPDN